MPTFTDENEPMPGFPALPASVRLERRAAKLAGA